jgi:RNA-directed DNA polymerase
MKLKPQSVPETATQLGYDPIRWIWAESSVWTNRMLEALEQGVKGGVWFSLIDKVYSERCLFSATCQVVKNKGAPGIDRVTVEDFGEWREEEVEKLSAQLRTGQYRPQAVKRVHIPKPGTNETRPLGIPTVRDRVVQASVVKVIEPIFERDFAEHSYGFRHGRGCKDALRRVDQLLKAGYTFVVDADLKSYFDTIPHDRLVARLRTKISDGRLLALIETFLKAEIMDGLREWTPTEGAPQGAVLSPLLSNIYLDPLDHMMAERGFEMVRYADDFVILCRMAEDAAAALEIVRQWTSDNGLTLHPTKTRIADAVTEGFSFLGYTFRGGKHFPRTKSLKKLKDTIRAKTRRNRGESMERIIVSVNDTLRGWFGYFKHSPRSYLLPIDKMVRRRLRSLLLRREGRSGSSRGRYAHRQWTEAYFTAAGLFSLVKARQAVLQSSLR